MTTLRSYVNISPTRWFRIVFCYCAVVVVCCTWLLFSFCDINNKGECASWRTRQRHQPRLARLMTHLKPKFFLVDRRVEKADLRVPAGEAKRHFQLFQIGEFQVAQRHIIVRHRLLLFYDSDVGFSALSHDFMHRSCKYGTPKKKVPISSSRKYRKSFFFHPGALPTIIIDYTCLQTLSIIYFPGRGIRRC